MLLVECRLWSAGRGVSVGNNAGRGLHPRPERSTPAKYPPTLPNSSPPSHSPRLSNALACIDPSHRSFTPRPTQSRPTRRPKPNSIRTRQLLKIRQPRIIPRPQPCDRIHLLRANRPPPFRILLQNLPLHIQQPHLPQNQNLRRPQPHLPMQTTPKHHRTPRHPRQPKPLKLPQLQPQPLHLRLPVRQPRRTRIHLPQHPHRRDMNRKHPRPPHIHQCVLLSSARLFRQRNPHQRRLRAQRVEIRKRRDIETPPARILRQNPRNRTRRHRLRHQNVALLRR